MPHGLELLLPLSDVIIIHTVRELLHALINTRSRSVSACTFHGLLFEVESAGCGEPVVIVIDGIGTLMFTAELHSVVSAVRDLEFLADIIARK